MKKQNEKISTLERELAVKNAEAQNEIDKAALIKEKETVENQSLFYLYWRIIGYNKLY